MAVRDVLLPIFLRRVARDTRLNWVYDWRSAWCGNGDDRKRLGQITYRVTVEPRGAAWPAPGRVVTTKPAPM